VARAAPALFIFLALKTTRSKEKIQTLSERLTLASDPFQCPGHDNGAWQAQQRSRSKWRLRG